MVHIHDGTLLDHKKRLSNAICSYSVSEFRGRKTNSALSLSYVLHIKKQWWHKIKFKDNGNKEYENSYFVGNTVLEGIGQRGFNNYKIQPGWGGDAKRW